MEISDRVLDIGLCRTCSVLSFHEVCLEKEPGINVVLGYDRRDTYPDLPKLRESAESGCGFCRILREVILLDLKGYLKSSDTERFEVRTSRIRFVVLKNDPEGTTEGLHRFFIDVKAFDFALGPKNEKKEAIAAFEIAFEVFAYEGTVQ